MKVSLKSKKTNIRAYGLDFNDKGVCDVDKKIAQSLIDSGALVEVKAKAKK